jgi:putative ABC transport system permease protein
MVFNNSTPSTESEQEKKNYHQLDRLVIQVKETEKMQATAEILTRLLQRRHADMVDYEIEIPELLLKQQQRTNDIFNYVLGAIAGISLLVGGIGIMNIMLASVLERIKEIGLRLSIGAKKSDVVQQFLFEAVMISGTGGLILHCFINCKYSNNNQFFIHHFIFWCGGYGGFDFWNRSCT